MKLEEIEKICDEATPGPWEQDIKYSYYPNGETLGEYARTPFVNCIGRADADAEFISMARTELPKLLAVAKDLEIIVSNFENLQKMGGNYHFDFTPNMIAARKSLEELEKE